MKAYLSIWNEYFFIFMNIFSQKLLMTLDKDRLYEKNESQKSKDAADVLRELSAALFFFLGRNDEQ